MGLRIRACSLVKLLTEPNGGEYLRALQRKYFVQRNWSKDRVARGDGLHLHWNLLGYGGEVSHQRRLVTLLLSVKEER